MLELEGITGGYRGETKIGPLSITLPKGQITALVGPNGCGKSTLMKIAAGLMPPYTGRVLLEGADISGMKPTHLARRVAYMAQGRNIPGILVKNLVLHGRFPYLGYPRHYRREDTEAAAAAMEQMKIGHLAGRSMAELSGGERQKAYIAMLLAQGGELLFMDEPTTYLDINHQLEVMSVISRLKAMGKTPVLILHDLNLAMRWADRLAVMQAGKIRFAGTPQEAFASGILEQVFCVRSGCYQTETDGTQYYFS
ncbi:ABC transporter ATP-binding protein [Oscillospiraceae bacterium MB08-C2-2]|nr:ABC transporter ATP-binding protein [Oscillospiraceae bacterium MB08-C2-2]